jgi:hypothetical protein
MSIAVCCYDQILDSALDFCFCAVVSTLPWVISDGISSNVAETFQTNQEREGNGTYLDQKRGHKLNLSKSIT